jgi:hypothetical protein
MASARSLFLRVLRSVAPLLLLAAPAAATSYVMVDDVHLADQATVIAEVRVDSSQPSPARRSAGTDYLVDVLRVVKGSTGGSSIVVRVPGGKRPDGMSLKIWGAPEFREGDRALLFLTERADGTYGILHLMLGAFHSAEVGGRQVALRNLSQATEVRLLPGGGKTAGTGADRPRDLDRFATWLADRAQGVTRNADYFLTLPKSALSSLTAKFTLFSSSGEYLRWSDFDSGGSITWVADQGGQAGVPGGGFDEFKNALSAWNADPLTPINYVYGGTTTANVGMTSFDGINAILYGDPNKEIDGTFDCAAGGVLAFGGPWFGVSNERFNGEEYNVIAGGDIVVNDGIDCYFSRSRTPNKDFEEMVTHELGHTLGLQHSCGDDTSPACSTDANKNDAIMRAILHGDGRGARIGVDDLAGTRRLYAEKDSGSSTCRASDRALCLSGKRFRVELSWVNQFDGSTGIGRAISATDVSGYFSFGDPSNIELIVKVLNFGNGNFKVFYGELTNLKFTMTVTDTVTGNFKTYSNTTGDCGGIDQDFFAHAGFEGWSTAQGSALLPGAKAAASGSCRPDRQVLCLLNGRFAVQVDWQNPFDGSSGHGGPHQLSSLVGTFFFSDSSNVELMTKIIPFPDRFVFFYGALTDFKYTLTVTDTLSGRTNTYQSTPGQLCGGLDNSAF